jgi:NADPH:quinone reductase-like Zn-dependent oxidoreductase
MTIETKKHPGTHETGTFEVPQIMHAAAIDAFGGPEALTLHDLPVPALDKGEVLIALHTAGVGSWDAEMRAGWYPGGHPDFPLILGTDGSGKVAGMGSHIRRFRIGDAVYAYSFANPKGGFYAEYVAVAAERVAPIPKGLGMREAGAIPTTGLTAIQGIDDALHVKRGEAVVIVGASGGVGTLAVQFAKLREARVLGVTSGEDGVALVRRLGADAAVDGRQGDVRTALQNFASQGVDGVLALTGGETLEQVIDSLKIGGLVAYPNGVSPTPKKRRGVRMIPYDAVAGVREFNHLGMAVEAANLRVPIAAKFPLAQAALAHKRLAEGHVLGKIVLEIEP